ncbi:MAG: hypothetical protein IKF91_05740 [Bacilli bacterium]|nr:hypothetical protein [Bacilli bacterium]
MLVQENSGARARNRITNLYPEHFIWINSQIKANKYLATRGREVLIKKFGSSSVNIVNIPPKGDSDYFGAWIRVYNFALDYLESVINYACRENQFIKNYNNNWLLNGKVIVWPRFNGDDAGYAKGLDRIFDEYVTIKMNYINSLKQKEEGLSVKKSSVGLKKPSEINIPGEKIDYESIREKSYRRSKGNTLENSKLVFDKGSPTLVKRDMVIQKISDGDKLGTMDISKLRNSKTDIVMLTCMDTLIPKEEDIFLENAYKCQNEGFNTGAFIYGRAMNEHTAAIEIKRIIKMLSKCGDNFTGLVIYSIDNNFILKNKDSDVKLLDFVNMCNSIGNTLKQYGYKVMISMNLESGKILDDINDRYNMQSEHDVIYMAFVRDESEIGDNTSSIIIDPGNDYDIVNIKNKELIESIKNSMKGLNKKI